jgi:hypothetical protein
MILGFLTVWVRLKQTRIGGASFISSINSLSVINSKIILELRSSSKIMMGFFIWLPFENFMLGKTRKPLVVPILVSRIYCNGSNISDGKFINPPLFFLNVLYFLY